jgi:hypothetical protein
MDKIVLLTDRLEECEPLISCLRLLFPECEIQVQPKQAEELGRTSPASKLSTAYRMFINFDRNLRKLVAENHA